MINDKKILAIIPARGGSKRLPRKNVLPLGGKPLIQWTIEAALSSSYIDDVFVSTDCSEIAKTAENCGLKIPYLRSALLSNDTASSVDVVLDVIKYYHSKNVNYDLVMVLQPTSPLRTLQDIDSAIEMLESKSATGVISVTECDHSPLWCNTLPEDNSFDGFISKELSTKRSQDLPTYYRLNGAIYLTECSHVKKHKTLFPKKNVYAFVMDKKHSIDIDDEMDFKIAETLIG